MHVARAQVKDNETMNDSAGRSLLLSLTAFPGESEVHSTVPYKIDVIKSGIPDCIVMHGDRREENAFASRITPHPSCETSQVLRGGSQRIASRRVDGMQLHELSDNYKSQRRPLTSARGWSLRSRAEM